MIINNRKDLDAAPDDVRDRFLASLARSINSYAWDGTEWVLKQDTAEIERFDFALDDFPDAPVPAKPDYNPDEKEVQAKRDRLQSQLDSIDARYHSDRSWREHVIANPDGFASEAVERMQAAEDEAQSIRDELAELKAKEENDE